MKSWGCQRGAECHQLSILHVHHRYIHMVLLFSSLMTAYIQRPSRFLSSFQSISFFISFLFCFCLFIAMLFLLCAALWNLVLKSAIQIKFISYHIISYHIISYHIISYILPVLNTQPHVSIFAKNNNNYHFVFLLSKKVLGGPLAA